MEIFRTDDHLVTKIIHDDHSETAIKTVSSCDTVKNPVTGVLEVNPVDRNKYSIFASISAGCPMACQFCYLTIQDMKYQKLRQEQILNNLKEAIQIEVDQNPSVKDKYIKVCWMGMGEAILQPSTVYDVTLRLLDWVFENNYAVGLDGVDLSTVLPKTSSKWVNLFNNLNDRLKLYPSNPNNVRVVHSEAMSRMVDYEDRSPFRMFFSLHSAIQETRDQIIPNAMDLETAAAMLREVNQWNQFNLIFHHMFMDGINDTEEEIQAVVDFMCNNGFQDNELRILRYNNNEYSDIKESTVFEQCICALPKTLSRIKVQISAGKEVKSACGQFIIEAP